MYFAEDEYFAQHLQNEFNFIQGISVQSLSKEKENHNPVDSKLEYLDPTPSIHDLFVRFNEKFFWGTLETVEVKWSNRMTKCAGICSFERRGRVCVISLSAPLLSLRPRKDLVETLLHEMIHAYLFITNNYRDRDDHGPEFHKHMYRINKEAGTKITVYHTFHDEVEYYQKHIWRCNGPCQTKKPFFGFVKRAVNRAPGPSDTWWSKHKLECNGTFIKISEPEKTTKKRSRTKKVGKIKDIRDYLNRSNTSKTEGSNKTSNIKTFADLKLNTPTCGATRMNSNTLVVTNHKKSGKTVNSEKKKQKVPKTKTKTETETSKSKPKIETSTSSNGNVREEVRKFWANKFPSPPKSPVEPVPSKKSKVECPVCSESFSEYEIQIHIDNCLESFSPRKDEQDVGKKEFDEDLKHCPVCSESILESEMNEHLENCLKCTFENEGEELNDDDEDTDIVCQSLPCPCCYKWVLETEMNSHIDDCLTLNTLKEEVLSS